MFRIFFLGKTIKINRYIKFTYKNTFSCKFYDVSGGSPNENEYHLYEKNSMIYNIRFSE